MVLELTEDERRMLFYGLVDWSGPSECTESLAWAMGFSDLADLHSEGHRIADAIYEGGAVSVRDSSRAMFAAEVTFASDVVGTGSERVVIQGGSDAHWVAVLRSLQGKVPTSRRFLGP